MSLATWLPSASTHPQSTQKHIQRWSGDELVKPMVGAFIASGKGDYKASRPAPDYLFSRFRSSGVPLAGSEVNASQLSATSFLLLTERRRGLLVLHGISWSSGVLETAC
jgi:hypothetical protein